MRIHWQIPFKAIRSGIVYTVNIYDANYTTGDPVVLNGGAYPFVTQENTDDDIFIPLRTQSGYIRIVDNGFAADGVTPFNWKDLVPSTDISRPVTLTFVSRGETFVAWQGFMQAQNFGGVLYGNPQEREFPVQCSLSILEGFDINYEQTKIRNFGYLLERIINAISVSSGGVESAGGTMQSDGVVSINELSFVGGADVTDWLLKRIDWQNFVNVDADGNTTARYNLYQCLEDFCRFWGFSVHTSSQNLIFTRVGSAVDGLLILSVSDLHTIARGFADGTTTRPLTINLDNVSDIFASVSQEDNVQRGPNKATVKANGNKAEENVINYIDNTVVQQMKDQDWQSITVYDDLLVRYTNDLLTITRPLIEGSAVSQYAGFNVMELKKVSAQSGEEEQLNVIHIKSSYLGQNLGQTFATLSTMYEHLFDDGYVELHADIYRWGVKYQNTSERGDGIGIKTMYIRLGIGITRATAKWFNGNTWQNNETTCKVSIGNDSDTMYFIYEASTPGGGTVKYMNSAISISGLLGRVFVDFLGSDDLNKLDILGGTETLPNIFDICDFRLVFFRSLGRQISGGGNRWGGERMYVEIDRSNVREYISTNNNNVRDEFNSDCIYASDNDMQYGYGVLMEPTNSFMKEIHFGSALAIAEQELADRVVAYWETSKRKLILELLANKSGVANINQETVVRIDSMYMYPVSIGRDWWNDVVRLILLEE